MSTYIYEVWDGKTKIAGDMDLDVALLLAAAYFEKYYADQIEITIKRKEN